MPTTYTIATLEQWFLQRKLTQAEFLSQHKIPHDAVSSGAYYQSLKDLVRVDLGNKPELVFFDATGSMVLWYTSEENILGRFDERDIIETYGEAEAIESSRAGKRANLCIYAQRGFAYAKTNGEGIHYIEVFPEMSLEEYLSKVYLAPGPFIR